MSIQWNCVYCGTVNPENDRFCMGCGSRFPDWQQRFISHAALLSGAKKPEFSSVSAPETPFVIPRPGEIVSGFFRFTEEVLSGTISQDSFQSRLEEVSELIRSVFSTMYLELEEISEAGKEYGSSVTMLLEFVHYTLNVSIQEMMLYSADGDSSHLLFGRMLAQRAELEYIQILEKLAVDAGTNPFTGEFNIVGRVAADVIAGLMDIEQFHPKLKDYQQHLSDQVEKARGHITLGFNTAGKYDGTNDEVLFKGLAEFRQAEDLLSQALVNLHNPHDNRTQ
ncbi:MAG: zinc ribbon domain-containing protein [Vulcanimicrobiota bacterium]